MNVNPIGSGNPSIIKSPLDVKENPQIKTLERRLAQLTKERDKAEKAKDSDKVRELNQEIQKIEQELEKLRSKEAEKEGNPEKSDSSIPSRLSPSDMGNYVDEFA